MAHRTIAQRDLRNDVARVLREAQDGTTFTITVHGRAVAELGPITASDAPRADVHRDTIRSILADRVDSEAWAADLDAAEAPVDDPWHDG
ncbi:MAG TPA: type II toxin-antitoxin system prevent-host-death family antitoxin [Solirubrobacteraceae bacterium]